MTKSTDRLKALISSVEIEDIRLVEARALARVRSPKEVDTVDLNFVPSAEVREQKEDGTFFVLATLDVRVIPKKEAEDNPAVSMRVSFELRYKLPQEFAATPPELKTFAERNGIFNAWPYWREFVQSTFARMNLPPFVLPLFRMRDTVKKSGQEKDNKSQEEKTE